ncbi:hypothetical protein LCGC14_1433490 [marine sediment metagenome]|uniref:Uncharacterized protein n=1 Tax=marine sediment metagenome TaxID=412755 RepID=A0A0F9MPR2_9ZZZZ
MKSASVEEFVKLRSDTQRLRDKATRLETERDTAKREIAAAEQALKKLGFDLSESLEDQLAAKGGLAKARIAALEDLLS